MSNNFDNCKDVILLFKDKNLIDKSKFINLHEIGYSSNEHFPKRPAGWIYTAGIKLEHYNEICNDPNIIFEDSTPVLPF